MKKGVVLLITLFFIIAISILVLKNLDDTDTILEKQNYILTNTQILIAIKNTQEEVGRLILENKDNIDDALKDDVFQTPFPLNIKDLQIEFTIKKYDRININDIKQKDSKTVQNLFSNNNVYNYLEFIDVYNEKLTTTEQNVETTKQITDIINTFILRTENQDIYRVVDNLGFRSEENLYELDINTQYLSVNAVSYYILDKEGKVKYFDISFK